MTGGGGFGPGGNVVLGVNDDGDLEHVAGDGLELQLDGLALGAGVTLDFAQDFFAAYFVCRIALLGDLGERGVGKLGVFLAPRFKVLNAFAMLVDAGGEIGVPGDGGPAQ